MNNLHILSLTKIRTLFFVSAFTALSVAIPLATHYFGGAAAGRLFLPMQFFVLVAGLTLGWRAGLAVGVLTPLISYSISDMPVIAVLPFVLIESATYGFFAGWFRERIKNIWLALAGAMMLGRVVLFLSILILPTKLVASQYMLGAISDGWRGIVLQLLLMPTVAVAMKKFLKN